jgi:hypothetical protein
MEVCSRSVFALSAALREEFRGKGASCIGRFKLKLLTSIRGGGFPQTPLNHVLLNHALSANGW